MQANTDIQPTFAQMQNAISELMQTNEQLRREVAELQASQQLLQLKNSELSMETKRLQLRTTYLNLNASVPNNVNVDSKSTQKNIEKQISGDTQKAYKPPPITIKGVKHFDK